jgi:hypothetical protein
MNGGLVKTSHLMERTDRLYRRAAELAAIDNLHPRKHDDDDPPGLRQPPPTEELIAQREEAQATLAKLESLSRPATKADVVIHLGEFLSKIPNGAKDGAYVQGLAEDVFESQPSLGVLELGLRTLRLNRESSFPPVIKEILRALARAARERHEIIWRLGKKRGISLECLAEKMFDRDPDQRDRGF